jgi:hypothetical protein
MSNRLVAAARTALSAGTRTAVTKPTINPNLVYNGDFEITPAFVAATNVVNRDINGTAAGNNTPRSRWGWFTNTVTGTVAAQFDTSVSHGGSASLKISTLATASRIDVGNSQFTTGATARYGWVKVSPNTSYNFSYWMKTNVTSGSSTGANILIQELQSDFTTVAATTNLPGTAVATTQGFTQYSTTITTNAATQFLRIRPTLIGNAGAGTLIMDAWFDDISITLATSPARLTA